MQRSLLYPLLAITLTTSGCSTIDDWGGIMPTAVGSAPFVYHPTVQQGTVITQEMVNQIRPGMEKSQVRFIMGTPTMVDTFHQDRWDYFYSLVEDGEKKESYRLTFFFENDKLSSMDGDFRPKVEVNKEEVPDKVFIVPPRED